MLFNVLYVAYMFAHLQKSELAKEKITRHDKRLHFKQFDFTLGFWQDIGLSVSRFGYKFKLGYERGVK